MTKGMDQYQDKQWTHKCLGIPQSHGNHDEAARKTATSKQDKTNLEANSA